MWYSYFFVFPMSKHRRVDLSDFRVKPGENIHMNKIKTDDVGDWDEESAMKRLEKNRKKIIELQDTLYAEHKQSLLVVLQAMDAAGKDSTIKNVTQGINPQGCSVVSFKQPSSKNFLMIFSGVYIKKFQRKEKSVSLIEVTTKMSSSLVYMRLSTVTSSKNATTISMILNVCSLIMV
jgi:polyphosphate kinase 2 (PPK2 family)